MTDLHAEAVHARLRLADIFDTLNDDQWQTMSLCSQWTVRDVAAHLSYPATASALKILVALAQSKFSLNELTLRLVRNDQRNGTELAQHFRATAAHRWTPPGFGFEAPLTDALVHTSDICRPLGIAPPSLASAARSVLDFLVTPKATRGFVAKGRIAGLRFETTDLNWGFGNGPMVTGSSEAIILGILGRPAAHEDLRGDGLAALRDRP